MSKQNLKKEKKLPVKSKPAAKAAQTDLTLEVMAIEKTLKKFSPEVTIRNDTQYEVGREKYKAIRGLEKSLDMQKKDILLPANETIKRVKAFFKPLETRLEVIVDAYQLELTRYANAKETARLQALNDIEQDGRITKVETIQSKKEAAGERADGTMKVKKLVITDASKIPNEYWEINESKLRADLIEGIKVKGAHIEEVLTVTSR